MTSMKSKALSLLDQMGVHLPPVAAGAKLAARSPISGEVLAEVAAATPEQASSEVARSVEAFKAWRKLPAPQRGELVRLFGEELRAAKQPLGELVSLEAGKILQEGLGEVQEMIDICDFAVGLSRQLYGLTIQSERAEHRMMETWHPVGPVLVISAFNFPVAVWAWNSALALVCGNSVIWKPSEKTPLTAMATQAIFERAVARFGAAAPKNLSILIQGLADVGAALVDDKRIPLISATGSTRMGRAVGEAAAKRFARTILELGGNNAAIIAPSADLAIVERAATFSAVGTAGQRCTTLRRLVVHASIYDTLVPRLKAIYAKLAEDKIGSPLDAGTLVGPLIDEAAYSAMQSALESAKAQGGQVQGGHRVRTDLGDKAFYVAPAIVEMPTQSAVVCHETFAPILYVMKYEGSVQDAIELNNAVSHGLSSCIFTNDLREAERFVSDEGSDCGIANVNIGTSGAEIGGAFGGEKETGGGRESGSDSWKAYMRRATNTINYGTALPLAQGIKFDL
jgi:aldehyde dehydrogenase (NAD+)